MQHDYDINSSDSISGLQFRQDVNAVLSAIKSSNSGATAPTTYIAGTIWLDTSTTPHILKKRNTANTGWDTIRIEDALGAPIASGATTTVGTYSGGNTVHITGTTTITSLGVSTTGTTRTLIFDSALTITHNATSLICPNGLSITTVTGDAITVICEDGALGYWRIVSSARILPNHFADTINDATAKTTPVDADLIGLVDSAASNVIKKLTWENIKATILSSFGVMISTATAKTVPVDADIFIIGDSAAANASKKTTWANIKTALTGLFAAIASPAFTGTPTAPTATVGTYTTQVATTAFVKDEIPNALNATGAAPIYACRAWVNFNGTGTVAIRASGNVSSITDNGAGIYTVNFTTAMSDVNYSTQISGSGEGESSARQVGISINTYSISSVKVYTATDTSVTVDHVIVNVAIFR